MKRLLLILITFISLNCLSQSTAAYSTDTSLINSIDKALFANYPRYDTTNINVLYDKEYIYIKFDLVQKEDVEIYLYYYKRKEIYTQVVNTKRNEYIADRQSKYALIRIDIRDQVFLFEIK